MRAPQLGDRSESGLRGVFTLVADTPPPKTVDMYVVGIVGLPGVRVYLPITADWRMQMRITPSMACMAEFSPSMACAHCMFNLET